MASGRTTTQELRDSEPTIIAGARLVREYEGNYAQLSDKITLAEGTGMSWNEVSFAKIDAFAVSEDQEVNNPQQLSDTLFSISPTQIAVHTVITDRVYKRLSKNAVGKIGPLAQNAMQRKKDGDGRTAADAFTQAGPGSTSTLTSGHINAYAAIIRLGGANEPSNPPHRAVLNSYQIKDLADELRGGIGTYPVTDGETARVYREGFRGKIDGVEIFQNDLIAITSNSSKGSIFAKDAFVLVQGRAPRSVILRNEKLGGGASEVLMYDEYAWGERSSGNWAREIISDTTTPTS